MPHVEIKCFPGRTDAQKKLLAERVADDVAEILVCKRSSVSVAIHDVPEEDWKNEVWDKEIRPHWSRLYLEPGYKE